MCAQPDSRKTCRSPTESYFRAGQGRADGFTDRWQERFDVRKRGLPRLFRHVLDISVLGGQGFFDESHEHLRQVDSRLTELDTKPETALRDSKHELPYRTARQLFIVVRRESYHRSNRSQSAQPHRNCAEICYETGLPGCSILSHQNCLYACSYDFWLEPVSHSGRPGEGRRLCMAT
jgi:hypothetical protein